MTDPTFIQPNWQPSTVNNFAGNLNQGVPAPAPLPSRIPHPPNELFVGRDAELRQLDAWLADPGAAVVVTGLGGMGKTQLAAAFAQRCDADRARWPGGVYWLPMSVPGAIDTAAANIGRLLGITGYDALPLPEQVEQVQRAWAAPTPRLLVFDNCEDAALFRHWRPTSGGARVLVTARRSDWPRASIRRLELPHLPRAAALELLCRPRADTLAAPLERFTGEPAADQICDHLGDLALAVHLAGAYLAQKPHLPLAAFLAELEAHALDHAAFTALDEDSPTEHLQHVAGTFALSFALLDDEPMPSGEGQTKTDDEGRTTKEQDSTLNNSALTIQNSQFRTQTSAISTQNSVARQVLDLAAHCAPGEPIPLDLLRRAVAGKEQTEDGEITTNDERRTTKEQDSIVHRPSSIVITTDAAMHRLVTVGLARYADEGSALLVHRLVATYARQRQPDADALADVLANTIGWVTSELDLPSEIRKVLSHARNAAETADKRESEYAAVLLNNTGQGLQELGDLNAAQALLERALKLDEERYGSEHAEVATPLNNLAGVAWDRGDLAEAKSLLERALEIDEAAHGPDHLNVANTLNNLGGVALQQGDFAAARALFERALRIWEAQLGPEHPDVATTLNNLGLVAQAQGDFAAARALLERALRIWEAQLGPEHPDVALNMYNLSVVVWHQGQRRYALGLATRALQIWQARLGPEHPHTRMAQETHDAMRAAMDTFEAQ